MSLIETLGGYDKARSSLQWLIDNDKDYIQEESNLYHSCLEHRRENNIFEVGDLVLIIDQFFGDSIFKIRDIYSRYDGLMIALFEHGWFFRLSALQHATPEEIKAGHRL